ncbi:Lactonase, 7-bladed beta-propeller-domain-containing protein [Aspergillus novoparasiticus]|uniref:Lactonase, 7-bladed beta-propeller-domain-containing protein n=1 Tax=Aspergillus novoparasiticus TaxID=986946 RepID=A0A5N6E8H1_9EURO|nr:Lactonase, 7-bladed beta-propeller-domain-containing protein [Aspergillus novoparasiticus]
MPLGMIWTFCIALQCLFPFSIAVNLYATHYDGNIYGLSVEGEGDALSLHQTHAQQACGKAPSWITVDSQHGLLWCSDEASPGTLTALEVRDGGALEELMQVMTPAGGVNSVIYSGDQGQKYLAVAHYGGTSISTWKIPFGDNEEVKPHEVFNFTLGNPGPAPQDQARPHQVLVDPTESFLVSPDLGADLVRVFSIDKGTGKLTTCDPVPYREGSGPRFGAFVESQKDVHGRTLSGEAMMYTVEELGGRLCSFRVSYMAAERCPTFKEISCVVPYPDSHLPTNTTTLSEIHASHESLHVSIRNSGEFGGNDSIVTLKLASDNIVNQGATLFPAGGVIPRTFSVNEKGDYVAVANQETSNVVIIERDPKSGTLLKEVASLRVGLLPQPGEWMGLSSIAWYE